MDKLTIIFIFTGLGLTILIACILMSNFVDTSLDSVHSFWQI